MERRGILSGEPNFEDRFLSDYEELARLCESLRTMGQHLVLTSGSFDLIHIGHARYLHAARQHGDALIVGVDSDAKIARRKGPGRPVVPQEERLEMLAHLRAVDAITLKDVGQPKWHLIDTVRPDVLIATTETYTDDQIAEIEELFGSKVVVLDRQATTSTSERIRNQQLNLAGRISEAMREGFPSFSDSVIERVVGGQPSPMETGEQS